MEMQGFPNTYIYRAYGHNKQRRTPVRVTSLANDKRIHWAEQSFVKSRVKRYPLLDSDKELVRVKRVKDENDSFIEWTPKGEVHRKRPFNDELWRYQWYLDTSNENHWGGLDLNVLPVYQIGYDGRGVRVSVLDDGIEHNHTDLQANYIAMTANNVKCGVGVAYGASVGGVRMLDGHISDRVEGEAIGYAWDKVDIYSASWGPNDDGRTVEGPGRLAIEALRRGITKGRNGKGIIYVWANGNGGGHDDNCNCDGYSSSIYTISVGSASQQGLFPWYGEICSSTLATAFSSGAYQDQKIATTDVNDSCTLKHSGTSAAAPLAAGIIALVLQANPDLTWRDVQHLIVWTSEYLPLSNNPGWQINGAGLRFNVRFGFGLLNAAALVQSALGWSNVPDKIICKYETLPNMRDRRLSSGDVLDIGIRVDDCPVNYIEHVELFFNAKYSRRGALNLYLTSPQGTKVELLSQRSRDTASSGFDNWPFTSVATWGENPNGIWSLTVADQTMERNTGEIGVVTLVIHGTKIMPNHMNNGPRKYNVEFTNDFQDVLNTNDIENPDINVPKSEAYDRMSSHYQNMLGF